MVIIVLRTGQCTPSKGELPFPWRGNELELGLFPRLFMLLFFPCLQQCVQLSPPAQFLRACSLLTAQRRAASHSLVYWHVTDKCAREKEKLPWSCLESPVLRRALLKPWTNILLSHIRSFVQYFCFLSLVTLKFFSPTQPLTSACLGHSFFSFSSMSVLSFHVLVSEKQQNFFCVLGQNYTIRGFCSSTPKLHLSMPFLPLPQRHEISNIEMWERIKILLFFAYC